MGWICALKKLNKVLLIEINEIHDFFLFNFVSHGENASMMYFYEPSIIFPSDSQS